VQLTTCASLAKSDPHGISRLGDLPKFGLIIGFVFEHPENVGHGHFR
jgi:hypothetical protein